MKRLFAAEPVNDAYVVGTLTPSKAVYCPNLLAEGRCERIGGSCPFAHSLRESLRSLDCGSKPGQSAKQLLTTSGNTATESAARLADGPQRRRAQQPATSDARAMPPPCSPRVRPWPSPGSTISPEKHARPDHAPSLGAVLHSDDTQSVKKIRILAGNDQQDFGLAKENIENITKST
eukprot:gnl/TRDRNA2_/TRDRNA2_54060_c0_seq2.p1 gnl/TRDRNA2_/TRDRNA2_54060_c0~~gnl/TRDRNA2_/TRDRNA2_54060_c0_seq2.p1  ORF type:complete len:177 (-),score=35.89 gnl/TRDRNA2_/TRDRNA2_54060_c0_seq2:207-737(-)